jgi:Flp pilus assembly protein TadD
LAEAEAAYRQGAEVNPKYDIAWYNLGDILRRREAFDEAEEAMRCSIALVPRDAMSYNNLGKILYYQGREAEAEAAYRQAMACDPDYISPRSDLVYLLMEQGRLEEAEALCRELVERMPEKSESWGLHHLVLKALGREEAAAEALAAGREAAADELFNCRAWIEALDGNPKSAASLLREALENYQIHPGDLRQDLNWQPFRERAWFREQVGDGSAPQSPPESDA